jgi:hypothetical protein
VNDPDRLHPADGFDDDAMFAYIVAHLNDDAAEPERATWPPAEEAATDDDAAEETAGESADRPPGEIEQWPINQPPVPPTPQDPPEAAGAQVWRAHEVDDGYEEHFEPPPVTPLPVGDLQFWAIIAGMGGGPLLLLYLVFFNRDASGYWSLTAIALSVGGFALLVSRIPGHYRDDDDGSRL